MCPDVWGSVHTKHGHITHQSWPWRQRLLNNHDFISQHLFCVCLWASIRETVCYKIDGCHKSPLIVYLVLLLCSTLSPKNYGAEGPWVERSQSCQSKTRHILVMDPTSNLSTHGKNSTSKTEGEQGLIASNISSCHGMIVAWCWCITDSDSISGTTEKVPSFH